jgi:hypothetical protein
MLCGWLRSTIAWAIGGTPEEREQDAIADSIADIFPPKWAINQVVHH